jgi:hypothetical protein
MKSLILIFVLIFSLPGISGCSRSREENTAHDPETSAKLYAKKNEINIDEGRAYSTKEYENGDTSIFDSTRTDSFAMSVVEKLKGKNYWEVCYDNSGGGLGGEVCFFIEKSSNQLIHIYRSK